MPVRGGELFLERSDGGRVENVGPSGVVSVFGSCFLQGSSFTRSHDSQRLFGPFLSLDWSPKPFYFQ